MKPEELAERYVDALPTERLEMLVVMFKENDGPCLKFSKALRHRDLYVWKLFQGVVFNI